MPDGMYRGNVYDPVDPENRGRLRLMVPQVYGTEISGWAEPTQPPAPQYRPALGDRVWVMFEGGDINKPIYISSDVVNAEKILAGSIGAKSIATDYLYAGRVKADQIDSGILTAGVSVAGKFTVANYNDITGVEVPGSKRAEISSAGLFTYKQDPADTTKTIETLSAVEGKLTVKGDIEADHLTIYSGSIQGGTNEIAEGAVLSLSTSVTTPTNPPVPQATYDTVQFASTSVGDWASRYGATFDGTYWYTVRFLTPSPLLEKWTAAGTLVSSVSIGPAGSLGGVVYAASTANLYMLAKFGAIWYVYKYNTALTYLGYSSWTYADGDRTPAIGWDSAASEILIAQSRATDNKVRIRRYTFNAGGSLNVSATAYIDTNITIANNLAGIAYGNFDFGAARYVLLSRAGTLNFRTFTFSSGTATEQTSEYWPTGATGLVGFHWDTTALVFKSMDQGGLLRTYEAGAGNRWTNTVGDDQWFISHAWYRSTAFTATTVNTSTTITATVGTFVPTDVGSLVLGTGIPANTTVASYTDATHVVLSLAATASASVAVTLTKETLRSPYATFTMQKRARLQVTTSNLPTGSATSPTSARVYLKKGVTNPGANSAVVNMTLQSTTTGSPPMLTITNAAFTPSNNPSASWFGTAGTPALIKDGLGNTLLSGDSSWTIYTPTWTAVTTNPTLGNGTLTGRYKDIGMIRHFEIQLTFGSTTTVGSGTYTLGLPGASAVRYLTFMGSLLDASVPEVYPIAGLIDVSSKDALQLRRWPAAAGTAFASVTHANPVTPASGDIFTLSGSYRLP